MIRSWPVDLKSVKICRWIEPSSSIHWHSQGSWNLFILETVRNVRVKVAYLICVKWHFLWMSLPKLPMRLCLSFTEISLKNNNFYLEIFLRYRYTAGWYWSLSLSFTFCCRIDPRVSLSLYVSLRTDLRGWHIHVSTFLAAGQTLTCQLVS